MNDQLVACEACGIVFTLTEAPTVCCPVCEHTTRKKKPHPKKGRVNKWWRKVRQDE